MNDDIDPIVASLKGHLPRALTGPILSDEQLATLVNAAYEAYADANRLALGPRGDAILTTPEEKSAHRRTFVEVFLGRMIPDLLGDVPPALPHAR